MDKKPINEQVVVITGASSGIGRESALHLARKGAKVVLSARRDEALDELVQQIREAGGEATAIPADVSVFSDVEALAEGAVATYGRIDTWVNDAGVLIFGDFEKTALDEARKMFDTNFWGELHGCRAALPILRRQGGGTIVNVTSVTARRPLPRYAVYSASKAAVNAMSEALRAELNGSGIEVVILMPASIDTPFYHNARTKEGRVPRPAPPIYPPSEVAKGIELAATTSRRDVFSGPAGFVFSLMNNIAPGALDKVLGSRAARALELSEHPKTMHGDDNLYTPSETVQPASEGGWRGRRYRAGELAGRVVLGLAALSALRRLARR